MDEGKETSGILREDSEPGRNPLPFDATTNFTLLGWVLGKWGRRKHPGKVIDFTLDD